MATFERQDGQNPKGMDLDAKDRDLEQYGVWVKAEPRDVFEEPESESLSPFAEERSIQNDSFLTEDEEKVLDAGEEPSGLPERELSDMESPGDSEDIPNIPDIEKFDSLEDLGVPVEDFSPNSIDLNPEAPGPGLPGTSDVESIDIDLKFDETLPSETPSVEGGFETATDFDDFLNSQETGESPEMELPGEAAFEKASRAEEAFSLEDLPDISKDAVIDDMAELERDLSSQADRLENAGARIGGDSSEILLKIAGELSSIKQELISLKSQVAAIKAGSPEIHREPLEETDKLESAKAGGFFDEEEDETIALTGDELDNILNTAEFSEESAESPESSGSGALADSSEDLLPESGDYSPAMEADTGSEEPAIEELHLPSTEDNVIAALAEEGVSPITPAPEDTSYLEEESSEPEELSLSEDQLPEVPLLEPNPEDLKIEDLEEDQSEDAEELPLAELESVPDTEEPSELLEETEDLEELTLDVENEPSDLVLEAPEHVELPIPEVEEELPGSEEPFPEFVEELPSEEPSDNLGEIALHQETSASPEGFEQDESAELVEIDLSEPAELEIQEPEAPAGEPSVPVEEEKTAPEPKAEPIPNRIKDEVRSVLSYLDKLLESLPEDKIEEFAKSDHFETYKKLFEELGLV